MTHPTLPLPSRRRFLQHTGMGFGSLALGALLHQENEAAAKLHFPAKAKRCIFLFMTGGPSHMDMFDPKPLLNSLDGQPVPPSFGKVDGQFVENDPLLLGSHRRFAQYGESGIWMSERPA